MTTMAARISFAAQAAGFVTLAVGSGVARAQVVSNSLLAVNHPPALLTGAMVPKVRPAMPTAPAPSPVSSTTLRLPDQVASGVEMKPTHPHALTIQRGVLTVDGLTAKVDLNYRIADLRYLYVYVPGVGTTVISDAPFAGAAEQKDAFEGDSLTVISGGNRLQLTAERRLLGTRSAFVKLDPAFGPSSRMPMIGFGNSAAAPYEWPGALKELNAVATAHPVPRNLKPNSQQETTCSVSVAQTSDACTTAVMTVAYRR